MGGKGEKPAAGGSRKMEMGNEQVKGGNVHRRVENKRHADECGSQGLRTEGKGQQQDCVLGLPHTGKSRPP